MQRLKQHEIWGQRGSFILAATGSAIGLGNIWKFPYMAGENGGGAFVLLYLLCILLIGTPIMMAEIVMGRRARANPISASQWLSEQAHAHKAWRCIGWLGAITGLLILSFYTVIAGWTLEYLQQAVRGQFSDLSGAMSQGVFGDLLANPSRMLLWHTLFSLMTASILALGVTRGLESAVRWIMPLLFTLLLVLLGYAIAQGEAMTSLRFMFSFNPSDISWQATLSAMGHAFFTLSLGMGAIMAYGAYMPSQQSVGTTVLSVALLDTLVALVAGTAIFAFVFATPGLSPGSGPGLMFVTLPVAFGNMHAGLVIGSVFFCTLVLAAWASAISMLEPGVAYMCERWDWSRLGASLLLGTLTWALGLCSLLSFNHWSDTPILWGRNFFESLDFLSTNLLLPIGGMLVALFVGWKMSDKQLTHDSHAHGLNIAPPGLLRLWRFVLRYIAPLAIAVVLVNGLFPILQRTVE